MHGLAWVLAAVCALAIARPAAAQSTASAALADSVGVSDSVTVLPAASVTVAEPIGVADSVAALPPASVTVDESVTVGDSVGAHPPANVTVAEAVVASDSVAALPPAAVTVNESVAVGDSVGVHPPANVTVNESVAVGDSVAALPPASVTVDESIVASDSVVALPPAAVTVNESVAVGDSVAALPAVAVTVQEAVGVGDQVSSAPAVAVESADAVGVTDSVGVSVAAAANTPPHAFIELPTDSAAYPVGASIQFIGGAYDQEDGQLADSALTWHSDRQGILGHGTSFSRSDLVGGIHHVYLVAVDSRGAADTAAVSIRVIAPVSGSGIDAGILPPAVSGSVGGSVRVPIGIGLQQTPDTLCDYEARIRWNPALLGFDSVRAGDVKQTLSVDSSAAATGVLDVRGRIASAPDRPVDTLLVLTLHVPAGPVPGDTLALDPSFSTLRSPGGADLRSELRLHPAGLCVASEVWGDVDGSGSVGSGDAVQMLRKSAGLPLSGGATLTFGDVNGDGKVDVADAILILRKAVHLTVPQKSPVGRIPVKGCALPGIPL